MQKSGGDSPDNFQWSTVIPLKSVLENFLFFSDIKKPSSIVPLRHREREMAEEKS
jgi:hypothetical protein